jgi:hypothetical protein
MGSEVHGDADAVPLRPGGGDQSQAGPRRASRDRAGASRSQSGVKVEFVNPAEAPHAGLWVTVKVGRSAVRQSGSAAGGSAR